MGYTDEEKEYVFDKNRGCCFHCGRYLIFSDYGNRYSLGGWVIDHGNPWSRGGVHDRRNWVPSCYDCNEEKHDKTTSEYGRRRERRTRLRELFGFDELFNEPPDDLFDDEL